MHIKFTELQSRIYSFGYILMFLHLINGLITDNGMKDYDTHYTMYIIDTVIRNNFKKYRKDGY